MEKKNSKEKRCKAIILRPSVWKLLDDNRTKTGQMMAPLVERLILDHFKGHANQQKENDQ